MPSANAARDLRHFLRGHARGRRGVRHQPDAVHQAAAADAAVSGRARDLRVRDIPWIFDSIERLTRKNMFRASGIFNFEPGGNVY